MPQIFQVLKCYRCLVFQVHHTKKSNKWHCKMCGEKQTIKRHYGLGNGQECRVHVQKLNSTQGDMLDFQNNTSSEGDDDDNIVDINIDNILNRTNKSDSKWNEYLDDNLSENADSEENEHINLEMYNKPKRNKFSHESKKKKRCNFRGKSYEKESRDDDTEDLTGIVTDECNSSNKILTVYNRIEKIDVIKNINNKIFKVPVIPSDSKWGQFLESNIKNNIDNEIQPYEIPNVTSTCNAPSTSHYKNILDTKNSNLYSTHHSSIACEIQSIKNTKCEENYNYAEVTSIQDNSRPKSDNHTKQLYNIFSLCNDDEIDNILNI